MSTKTTSSATHDSFFRASMQHKEVATAFLKAHLPPSIIKRIQFDTLKAKPNHFISNNHQTSISDMLYSVNIDDALSYIYILIEHQSRPLRLMAYRMLRYLFEICDLHLKQQQGISDQKKLPVILPLVFIMAKYPHIPIAVIFTIALLTLS